MVKRFALPLILLPLLLAATPASAQEFSRFDMAFGYGNYGIEHVNDAQTELITKRANGFVMHTDIALLSWLTFENVTGAYSLPNDVTMITNTFGTKLIARDVVDGRISPYVAGGFGIGYYSSNQTGRGFSTGAARYAVGVDLNMSDAMAIRLDVGRLAVGSSVFRSEWQSNINIAVGVVFSLGY